MLNNSHKKILIISYYFAPGNLMGAVRPTKLAKYFNRKGYNVNVICSQENKWLFLNNEIKEDEILLSDSNKLKLVRPNHSLLYKGFAFLVKLIMNLIFSTSKGKFSNNKENDLKPRIGITHLFVKNAMFIMALLQDFDFTICAIFSKKTRLMVKGSTHMISSYGPYASHFLAYFFKKIYGNKLYWIADFRDPIAQPTDTSVQYILNKWIENKICSKADKIIAVSKGYLETIVDFKFSDKAAVITNGYDNEDLFNATKNSGLSKKFIISYTGTTYAGRRDLTPLFLVIKDLLLEKVKNIELLEFHYAGPENNIIDTLALKVGIEKNVHTYGNISRNEAIDLNYNSKLLVVATWNDKEHVGVLPGKFFESLLFKKPLIILVNGKIDKSEIVEITKDFNLGVSYEAINDEIDYYKLKAFLKEQLSNFLDLSKDCQSKVDKFEYQNITCEYEKLL